MKNTPSNLIPKLTIKREAPVSVRLDKALRLALASRCEKEERPASFIIRRAIKRELGIARQPARI